MGDNTVDGVTVANAEITLPTWSKEDFLAPDGKPYSWILEHTENAYMRSRLLTIVEESARKCGIRNFKRLFSDFESIQQSGNKIQQASGVVGFSNLPDEIKEFDCGEYECSDEHGVTIEDRYGGTITVCPHPILPTKRFQDIETGECKIEISFTRDNAVWKKHIVDMDTIRTARKITDLATFGVSVNSETAKYLVQFLSYIEDRNYTRIQEHRTVGHLGWIKDSDGNLTQFAPYIEKVAFDDNGNCKNELQYVTEHGDYDKWLDLAKSIRKDGTVEAKIALAASFASVLVQRLNALPFLVHIWGGDSGSGKTTALMLAASVWANPNQGCFVKTTKATEFALEKLEYFVHNMPLCLDELQLIQENRQRFDSIIYALTEGSGKPRGTRSGRLQATLQWSNVAITCGEETIISPNSKAGAMNRVIDIGVKHNHNIFKDGGYVANLLKENYGFAGKRFVEMFSDPELGADDLMRKLYNDYMAELRKLDCATDKQIASAAIILVADELATKWIFHDYCNLRIDELSPYLVSGNTVDTSKRAYEWLTGGLIPQHEEKFNPHNENYSLERWGRFERSDGTVLTEVDGAPAQVSINKVVLENQMRIAGYNPQAFYEWAYENGLLYKYSNGYSHIVRLSGDRNGSLSRCVTIVLPQEEKDEGKLKSVQNSENNLQSDTFAPDDIPF